MRSMGSPRVRRVTSRNTPRQSLIDRVLRRLRPTAVAEYCPPPREIATGVWIFERRLRFPPGLVLPCNMTAIRLGDGALVLIAPLALDDSTRRQIATLGSVAAVIAPSSFHYLFAAAYGPAFPGCRTYLAPGLPERVPSCPAGTVLADELRPPGFADLEHCVFGPVNGAAEIVFLHRPSATLLDRPRDERHDDRAELATLGVARNRHCAALRAEPYGASHVPERPRRRPEVPRPPAALGVHAHRRRPR